MVQQFLPLLPREMTTIAQGVAASGAIVGFVLWLAGSRFSRTLIALLSVSAGALVGLLMPNWFHTGLEGWATAVLGAIALGVTGFVLHRMWVGTALGLLLAAWAFVATLVLFPDPKGWSLPTTAPSNLHALLLDLWNSLTPEARKLLPFACGIGLLSGFAGTMLWPRMGTALLYSLTGVSMLVVVGLPALSSAKPEWLTYIPRQTSSQVIVLLCLVAFGVIVQWRCAPSITRKPAARSANPLEDE